MYCRVCDKIRQEKNGGIYCSISYRGVGLNQVCCVDKYELDKRIAEDIVIEIKKDK